MVFVKVNLRNKLLIILSIYKRPITKLIDFKAHIGKNMLSISRCKNYPIICGDFNLDLLKINEISNDACTFYNDMNTMALVPTICKPTRSSNSSCKLIDDIFASNLHNFYSVVQ